MAEAVSDALSGNMLEAINLALDVLECSYEEQDLSMTGKSVVVLSAGSGVYEVDYRLSQMTKQRILDDGIGCDLNPDPNPNPNPDPDPSPNTNPNPNPNQVAESRATLAAGGVESLDMLLLERPGASRASIRGQWRGLREARDAGWTRSMPQRARTPGYALVDRAPGRSATHTCEPRLGQRSG